MERQQGKYMDLLNLASAEECYREVKKLASELSDEEHLIRSCIFDLHAAIEVELRRVHYFLFESLLFLTEDETENARTRAEFERAVQRLSFAEMYRLLRPVLNSWPYPELKSFEAINQTRNAAAHGRDPAGVLYRGRSPFREPDAFAQMYFEVWAIKNSIAKFFDWTISGPQRKLRRYYEKYGDI